MQHGTTGRTAHLFWPLALLLCGFCVATVRAEQDAQHIRIELGDYRFEPDRVEVRAGMPVVLELVNTDLITPHTFTIRDKAGNLNINQTVTAGETVKAGLPPLRPGVYTFFCTKKLPLMKSHRERGMEGTLIVTDE